MRAGWSYRWSRALPASRWLVFLALFAGVAWKTAAAGAPDWLRATPYIPLPKYPEDTKAVVLMDEQVTTVKETGEITTVYRTAVKILRPEGRSYGQVTVHYDSETRLVRLQGWCIPAQGKDYEVKEKDAVEHGIIGGGILYEDTHFKTLTIPAADPGNIVGWEYEQKHRPTILQDTWVIEGTLPQRKLRFVLQLPAGWEFKTTWLNHASVEPKLAAPNQWVWEIDNIPAVEHEAGMPHWRAVVGRMGINYFPKAPNPVQVPFDSWQQVGSWYSQLTAGRREPSPAIRQKVQELTARATTSLEKIRALAEFVQRDVRYVAIEIGIGGYRPHAAQEVFANRYGDCKDKATLLSSMLWEAGIESYYLVVHSRRGAVTPEFATPLTFNHVILAIKLPADVPTVAMHAVYEHNKHGKLLLFDPTNERVPLGNLAVALQAGRGLLVTPDGGELVGLPLLPPSANRLQRVAHLRLGYDGSLRGDVEERRSGTFAESRRAELLEVPLGQRAKVLERFLAGFLASSRLEKVSVADLEMFDRDLVLDYSFSAQDYAETAGVLLLVHPRVLGEKAEIVLESKKERKFPLEFSGTSLQTDVFEITLPTGYKVDELPLPLDLDAGVAHYRSKLEVRGNLLRYEREYQVKQVVVPVERIPELKTFFRKIAADERSTAVLKRSF